LFLLGGPKWEISTSRWLFVTDLRGANEDNCRMTPELLGRTVQDFLSEASGAVVLEDGAVTFDLGQSKYSIAGEHNKCVLHLWSAERNTVRRVLDAEVKNGMLRLAVQRLGQARPTKMEICRERDRRSPTAKKAARVAYEGKLRRALERHFRRGSGEIVWADLCARASTAGADRVRGAGSQRVRNAKFD
jgi:hypothetical protein